MGIADVFGTLIQSDTPSKETSFWYNLTNTWPTGNTVGEIMFAGKDSVKYSGEVLTLPISSKRTHWSLSLDFITFEDSSGTIYYPDKSEIIVDTGTTLMYLGVEAADSINAKLGAQLTSTPFGDAYTIQCSTIPTTRSLSFFVGGSDTPLTLNAKQIFFPSIHTPGVCKSIIRRSSQVNMVVIGALFLQNFYVVYDYGAATVGFAKTIQAPGVDGIGLFTGPPRPKRPINWIIIILLSSIAVIFAIALILILWKYPTLRVRILSLCACKSHSNNDLEQSVSKIGKEKQFSPGTAISESDLAPSEVSGTLYADSPHLMPQAVTRMSHLNPLSQPVISPLPLVTTPDLLLPENAAIRSSFVFAPGEGEVYDAFMQQSQPTTEADYSGDAQVQVASIHTVPQRHESQNFAVENLKEERDIKTVDLSQTEKDDFEYPAPISRTSVNSEHFSATIFRKVVEELQDTSQFYTIARAGSSHLSAVKEVDLVDALPDSITKSKNDIVGDDNLTVLDQNFVSSNGMIVTSSSPPTKICEDLTDENLNDASQNEFQQPEMGVNTLLRGYDDKPKRFSTVLRSFEELGASYHPPAGVNTILRGYMGNEENITENNSVVSSSFQEAPVKENLSSLENMETGIPKQVAENLGDSSLDSLSPLNEPVHTIDNMESKDSFNIDNARIAFPKPFSQDIQSNLNPSFGRRQSHDTPPLSRITTIQRKHLSDFALLQLAKSVDFTVPPSDLISEESGELSDEALQSMAADRSTKYW